MSDELIRRTEVAGELTVEQLVGQMEKLRDVMKRAMVPDVDYGQVPGTNSKPTLLKPGAEKLAQMHKIVPEFHEVIVDLPNGHREYRQKCRLIHVPTQAFVGEATGTCSTFESKYRWRGGARKCPKCGKETIKKSKFPPRNAPKGTQAGFYCYSKIGGCGAEFSASDQEIVSQSETKTENPDIADCYNTVQQISQKRAFVAAVKTATASSELFTMDLEDDVHPDRGEESQETHDDTRSSQPQKTAASPPAKPKPQLSEEFTKLRDSLYKMMRMEPGNAIKAHADAVVALVCEGISLNECAKDDAVVKKVMDELIARNAVGSTTEEIYRDALVKAGIALPQWLADAMQPVVS